MAAKKKTAKKAVKKKSVKKAVKKAVKKGAKKPAFGGYSISFKGCEDSMESVFGAKPVAPSEMTKKLWAYVKRKKLSSK